jgi:uncharacterized protein with PIN domain
MQQTMEPRFIVDINAGKLARWLRIIGYDTLLFTNEDDGKMIKIAAKENRIILTRDSQIMKRRLITSGKLKAILIEGDESKTQLQQIASALKLDYQFRPFTICLECNHSLIARNKEEVSKQVPPHVLKTQNHYMECPSCHRIFWRGTHWQAMMKELEKITMHSQKQPKAV